MSDKPLDINIQQGSETKYFDLSSLKIANCMGCFGCFVKTPGKCVIPDACQEQGTKMAHCDEFIIVSECVYGGYSPDLKIQLDRILPYLHADFAIVDGEMHHAMRYDNDPMVRVYFYGSDITEREKDTAKRLLERNSKNLGFSKWEVNFYNSCDEALKAAGLGEEALA